MALFDVDYSYLGKQLLPPDKRGDFMLAWVKSLLSPLQYLHDLLFTSFRLGSSDPLYTSGTYAKGSRVKYNNAIYESLINGNTDSPTTSNWRIIQANFIGIEERAQYNGQKIVLEYALNKWFRTTFRQPGGSNSDIYISGIAYVIPPFRSAGTEESSSISYSDGSSEPSFDGATSVQPFNMTINIPVAVYNALDSIPANRDKILRQFADQYIIAGILYNIITY